MKFIRILLPVSIGLLCLTGCGGKKKDSAEVNADPAQLAQQLQAETVTSDQLTEASANMLESIYFVDPDQIDSGCAYLSSGASACEVAVIKCKDSDYAGEVVDLFKNRVTTQSDLFASYNADEVKKLDKAIVQEAGTYAVLVVCDDTAKAQSILEENGF